MHRGTGEMYEFTLLRSGTKFKCLAIEFDINDTYEKWARLYNNHILPKKEPQPDFVYKYDVKKIDWATMPKTKIYKARNNHAVIGDWEVLYSPYKMLYVQAQKTALGYSDSEIETIKNLTAGYSSKKQLSLTK
jgi:hypothetical protein